MKTFPTLGAFGLLAAAQLAGAATTSHYLRVKVPFAFVVAGLEFSPGEYSLKEDSNGIVTVQGQGKAAAVISSPEATPRPGQPSSVRFTSASRTEYLSGFAVEGQGSRAISVPALERKLTLAR